MAEVKILIEGYASADNGGRFCSTVTLVQDKGLNIIVDPGTLPNQKLLVDKLKEFGLFVSDINVVYITHSHIDHYRNIGMFPQAKSLDYWGWWDGDVYSEYKDGVTDDIEMIKTPGHSYDGTALLVKTDKGTIAICGDVFWQENFSQDDSFASDKEKLEESRKKVLELADYVIPGHGKMFKTKK